MSIEQTLRDFLSMEYLEYYESNFGFVCRGLLHEKRAYIEQNEIVVERKCDYLDLGTIAEIEKFADELATWAEETREIRNQWLWDKEKLGLTADLNFREIFGEHCNSLEYIRDRCRRILKHLPEAQKDSSHRDLMMRGIKLHGQGSSWPEIAEALFGDRIYEPSCTKAIKAFAKKAGIKIASRPPGRRVDK